jgi:hypothetical protein
MIDEKKIPQRIYIKDSQLTQCEVDGVADVRINATPFKTYKGKLCEYVNLKALWHDVSEIPEEGEQILYTATEGGEIVAIKVTTTALYDFIPWNEVVRDFNISKWCYIEDLLPKGGNV